MSTLKVNSITNNGSAVDLTNGAFQIGGNDVVQGYTESASEPSSPTKGDIWWDSANEVLYQYLNGEFKELGTVTSNWSLDLSSFSYDSVSMSTITGPAGSDISSDGTVLIYCSWGTNSVYRHNLSTPYDLSTASSQVSSVVLSEVGSANPYCLRFSPDGTKLYISGTINKGWFQYTLSTPFDITTRSYDSVNLNISNYNLSDLRFNSNGTKAFVFSASNQVLYEYSLPTPYSLSGPTLLNTTASFSGLDGNALHALFDEGGEKMYIYGFDTDKIHQHTLATPFDTSSFTNDGVSFSLASPSGGTRDVIFSSDGTKMYATNYTTAAIYQYSTGL